jgi:hypothetical protein
MDKAMDFKKGIPSRNQALIRNQASIRNPRLLLSSPDLKGRRCASSSSMRKIKAV